MPRQTYSVTFPDGHVQRFDGPTGMTDADLIQRAKQERGFAGGDIPTSWAGGATRHLLEDEPQTVNALLGGLATASGAGAPLVAAIPAATSGLKHLSQFLATGRTDAPTVGGAVGDVLEGAAMGYGGDAIAAGARGLGAAKAAAGKVVPAGLKRLLTGLSPKGLAMDAATSKPVLGALERLGEGFTPDGMRSAFGSVARGLTPGVEAEAAPAAEGFRGLEAAARRRAVAEANPGYPKFLADATAGRPTGAAALEATGWPGSAPAASGGPAYPSWLRSMGAQATEAQPAAVAGLETTGTGARAAGQMAGRDYPAWLRSMGTQAAEAQPAAMGDAALEATGWPGSAPAASGGPAYPSWLRSMGAKATEAQPATTGSAALEASGWPGAAPAAEYPTWGSMGALQRAGQAVGQEVTSAAPAVSSAVADEVTPAVTAIADAAPAAAVPKATQRGAPTSRFAEFSPEARAARAAERDAKAAAFDSPEQAAALEELLGTDAFSAIQRHFK